MMHSCQDGFYVQSCTRKNSRGTLLFIHGLGESGLCFEGLLASDALGKWDLFSLDSPGYGKAPWAERPLTLTEQADRFASWLVQSGLGPVVLLGHSMGGVSGLYLCETHPPLVKAFINVEGNISSADCVFSSRAAADSLDTFLKSGFEARLQEIYKRGDRDPILRNHFASMRLADPRQYHCNSQELVAVSKTELLAERMAALPIPNLYVAGIPNGAGQRTQELLDLAGVRWMGVQRASHWPFLDQPRQFLGIMCAFLEEVG